MIECLACRPSDLAFFGVHSKYFSRALEKVFLRTPETSALRSTLRSYDIPRGILLPEVAARRQRPTFF